MASISAISPDQWPEIEPLPDAATTPPFPTDALPLWLSHFVRAQAEASQVPEDLPGMLALSALSAATQGRLNAVANNATWEEPICLYTAIALPPGERKSSVFSRMTAPLRDWEYEVQEREWPEVSESQAELAELEKAVSKTDDAVAKQAAAWRALQRNQTAAPDTVRAAEADLNALRDEAVAARVALAQHRARYKMRLIYNDLTPEACAQALAQQRYQHAAIMSDEGGVFEVLTGSRYADRLNLDVFLKGHSGDDIYVDRVGRDSEAIKRPILTLGLAVQPSVLIDIGKNKQMHGRGLLARFAYSIPTSMVGDRLIDAPNVPDAVRAAYHDNMRAIAESAYQQTEVARLFLSDDADSVFMGFQQRIEPRLKADIGDLSVITDWSNKLMGLILRIAALMAVARERGIPQQIEYEDIVAAISFDEYLIAHAMMAHAMMGITPNVDLEHKILRRIINERWTEFKTRELQRAVYATRALSTEELEEVLEELVKMGYIRRVTKSLKPLRYYWTTNPALHEETSA